MSAPVRARRLLRHLPALLAVAVLAHFTAVWALPWAIMARLAMKAPAETRVPRAVHLPPMTDHRQRTVVMPSPDLLYATCAFDLRERPLRLRADPHSPHYWSVALYAANSDNFFVRNDRQAAGRPIDLWLVGPRTGDDVKPPAGSEVVRAPTSRGLLLMRLLVADYASEQTELEAARRSLRCEPA